MRSFTAVFDDVYAGTIADAMADPSQERIVGIAVVVFTHQPYLRKPG